MTDNFPKPSPNFSQRLVSVDRPSAGLISDIQQELNTLFERKLTVPRQISFAIVSIVALISAAVCGYLAATETELPVVPRIGLGVGTVFGLAWAFVGFRILKKGAIDRRSDSKLIASMVWVFTVLMVVFFLISGMMMKDRILGLILIVQSLAFLIGAAVIWMTRLIERSELSTREKLLQIELLLAELHEKK